MFLADAVFSTVVASTPLFAIDLLIVNEQKELLLGKRLNAPAKGFWFVPGGRVLKNETLECTFQRLTLSELGIDIKFSEADLLGLYEHFYQDSVFGNHIGTHYINAAHVINLKRDELTRLPVGEQHDDYRWVALDEIDNNADIHPYTKAYLPRLILKTGSQNQSDDW